MPKPKSRNVGGKNQSYWGARKRKKDYDAADDWRRPKENPIDRQKREMDEADDQFKDIFE